MKYRHYTVAGGWLRDKSPDVEVFRSFSGLFATKSAGPAQMPLFRRAIVLPLEHCERCKTSASSARLRSFASSVATDAHCERIGIFLSPAIDSLAPWRPADRGWWQPRFPGKQR